MSVPLQFNWDYPVGVDEDTRFLLNLQPVIPLSLSTDWNLIVRWIMPYLAQPSLAVGVPPTSGLSDITASFFISPSKPKGFVWSVAADDSTAGVPSGPVNASFVQPFLSYTTSRGETFGINTEAAANWEVDEPWTAPVHLTASKLLRFASWPMSIGGGVGVYAAAPGGSPDWRLRFSATLLLPRT